MKIIKKILIAIVVIIAIPLIAALFVPKTYTVSVTETILQPKLVVYDYVRILDNQKNYSEWVMADPNSDIKIEGTDGTVGATQKWNSKDDNVGEGSQTITALTPDRMDIDLNFIRPFEGHAKAADILEAIGENETKITMEFYSESPYPMNLPSYLFGRKMIAETSAKNLKNLKAILEKQ
ncbi:MAG: SRPBCC family protein [Bacteroidia bacterium]